MNIVYIFGAGASASIDESVPVIANFFEKAVDFVNTNNDLFLVSFIVAEEARAFSTNHEIQNISVRMGLLGRLLGNSKQCSNDCEMLKDVKTLKDAGIFDDIETKCKDYVMDNLIGRSLKNLKNLEDWPKRCSMLQKIRNLLEKDAETYRLLFKKDPKRKTANLEKVLTDFATRRTKSRKDDNAYTRLQFLIGGLFHQLDKDLSEQFSSAAHQNLSEFVASSNDFKHTFISFNYDLWLEKALFNMGVWRPKNGHGSYPIRFYSQPIEDRVGIGDICKIKEFSSGGPKSRVMVLKPHGSLSWRFGKEPHNGMLILEGDEDSCVAYNNTIYFPAAQFVNSTEVYLAPLIVPPTPNKDRSHPLFRKTDQDIIEAITQADLVVVIGWSMPETDEYIRCILLRARSERKEQLRKIFVCGKGVMAMRLSSKFETIFRPEEIRTWDQGFNKGFVEFLRKEL